jgi:hypothetical protein
MVKARPLPACWVEHVAVMVRTAPEIDRTLLCALRDFESEDPRVKID